MAQSQKIYYRFTFRYVCWSKCVCVVCVCVCTYVYMSIYVLLHIYVSFKFIYTNTHKYTCICVRVWYCLTVSVVQVSFSHTHTLTDINSVAGIGNTMCPAPTQGLISVGLDWTGVRGVVIVEALVTWAIYTQGQLLLWSSLIITGVVPGYN